MKYFTKSFLYYQQGKSLIQHGMTGEDVEIEHGLYAVQRDNPRALAWGLSTAQAHKPCSISLVP